MDIEVKKEIEEINNEEKDNTEINNEEVNEEIEEVNEEENNTEINNEEVNEENENKKNIPWGLITGAAASIGIVVGIVIGSLFSKNSSNKKISALSNALKNSNDINTGLRVENLMLKDELKYSDALNKKMASDLLRSGRELGGKEMRRRKK
ncbi:MAG: hypothetical protein PUA68_00995 [Bacilli bacterium]|nr:hypothetical protein [Bacilli bacterium]